MGLVKTMRAARREWRAQEARLAGALAELNHQYLALLRATEAFQLAPDRGLLHTARVFLQEPLDLQTRELGQRLKDAGLRLGTGICRRAPVSVRLDTEKYGSAIAAISRRCRQLAAKLNLAKKVLTLMRQHPDWHDPHILNQALSSPESVWLAIGLRQRRRLSRQYNDRLLEWAWQTKLGVGRNWLELLEPSLSPRLAGEFQGILVDLAVQAPGRPADGPNRGETAWDRLEYVLALANEEATAMISQANGNDL